LEHACVPVARGIRDGRGALAVEAPARHQAFFHGRTSAAAASAAGRAGRRTGTARTPASGAPCASAARPLWGDLIVVPATETAGDEDTEGGHLKASSEPARGSHGSTLPRMSLHPPPAVSNAEWTPFSERQW